MKQSQWLLLGGIVAFVLMNTYAISREFYFIPVAALLLVFGYLLVFKFDWLLYSMAFLTPLSVPLDKTNFSIGLSLPSEIMMVIVTLFFLARFLLDYQAEKKVLKHPITIAIMVYLSWMLITSISSELPLVSFKFFGSKIWFIFSSFVALIYLAKKDIKNAIVFINCYAAALCLVIVGVTIKYVMLGFPKEMLHWIMSPFYNDHTAYGAVIAMFLCVMAGFLFFKENSKKERLFYFVAVLILLLGLYLSYSRAAWISVVAAMMVLVLIKLKIRFSYLVLGFLLFAGVLYTFSDQILYQMGRNDQDSSGNLTEHLQSMSNISTDASNVERLNRWVAAFGMIEERPVLGWGPGTYQFVYAPFQKSDYKTIITTNFGDGGNAHSEYIGPTAESGFMGLFTVLALVIASIYIGIRTYKRSQNQQYKILSLAATLALITYYVHGVLNNFLDTDKLSLPFWMLMALIVWTDIRDKGSEKFAVADQFNTTNVDNAINAVHDCEMIPKK